MKACVDINDVKRKKKGVEDGLVASASYTSSAGTCICSKSPPLPSVSIAPQFVIASLSLALSASSLVYSGNFSVKKHVAADGSCWALPRMRWTWRLQHRMAILEQGQGFSCILHGVYTAKNRGSRSEDVQRRIRRTSNRCGSIAKSCGRRVNPPVNRKNRAFSSGVNSASVFQSQRTCSASWRYLGNQSHETELTLLCSGFEKCFSPSTYQTRCWVKTTPQIKICLAPF